MPAGLHRGRRPRVPLAAWALVHVLLLIQGSAGSTARAAEPPWGPLGRSPVPATERPADAVLLSCSERQAVCVHGPPPAAPDSDHAKLVREVLAAAEAALFTYSALGLPAPRADGGLGGSFALDVYLSGAAEATLCVADALEPVGSFDQVSAFVVTPPRAGSYSCALGSDIARAVAEAVLLGLDAGLHDGTLAMQASYLASLAAPCSPLSLLALDEIQRQPEAPLSAGPRDRFAGTMLLPYYLDAAYGVGRPAALGTGLIAISGQLSDPSAIHWENEPDIYDSLRTVLRDRRQTLGDMLLDLAVARAFMGSRSDGQHLPDTERFGDLGRPRFEWVLDFDELPRRVAPLRPIHPTGATYLWLDLKGAPAGAQLSFYAEWEESFVFRWSLVKVDAQGRELGRHSSPELFGEHRVHLTIAELTGVAAILVAGTSVGNDDRSRPFDPDAGPTRAASYEVTLAPLKR